MKYCRMIFLTSFILLFINSVAFADNKFYVKVSGLVVGVNDSTIAFMDRDLGHFKFKTGEGFSIEGGIELEAGFDLGFEYSYRSSELDRFVSVSGNGGLNSDSVSSIDTDISTVMINLSRSFDLGLAFNEPITGIKINPKPYLMAGLGASFIDDIKNDPLTWQFGGGIDLEFDSFNIFTGYRRVGMSDLEHKDITALTTTSDIDEFVAGLKVSF